jgi:hypothetical protein
MVAAGLPMSGAPRRRARIAKIVGIVVFASAFVILFREVLFAGGTFVERDLASFWRPLRAAMVRVASAEGALPLWNPLLAHGQPLAANPQYALFHPLTALFFVLPFEWAFRLQVLLSVLGSALSMRALLQELGCSRPARFAGALSWALGSCVLGATSILPFAIALASLPLFLAGIAKGARKGPLAGLVPGSIGLGLLVLAGQPEPILVALALAFPVMAASSSGRSGPRRIFSRSAILAAASVTVLGLLLGSAALLPGLGLIRKTVRASGLRASESLAWSFPPQRLVEFVVPRAFGRLQFPHNPDDRSPALYPDVARPMHFLYPGLAITILAGLVFRWRPRHGLPWLLAGAFCLIFALGRHLPVLPEFLRTVPGAAILRFPEKVVFGLVFCVTVMGALGLDEMRRRPGGSRSARATFLTVAALLAMSGLAYRGFALVAQAPAQRPVSLLAEDLGTGAMVALLCAAALAVGSRLTTPLRLAPLLAILAADLVFHGRAFVTSRPEREVAAPPPPFDLLPTDLAHRTFHLASLQYAGSTLWMAPPPVPAGWGIPIALPSDFSNTELRWSREATDTILSLAGERPDLLEPLLARRGVSTVVVFHPSVRVEATGILVPPELKSPLIAIPVRGSTPLAFFAQGVLVAAGHEEWKRAIRELGARSVRTAIFDPADIPQRPEPLASGDVESLRVTPDRIAVDVETKGPGEAILLLNQTWDTGWRARIDGNPARLLRVDLSLSALQVPPGRHSVDVTYHAPLVFVGLGLSGATALALALVAFALRLGGGAASTRAPPN